MKTNFGVSVVLVYAVLVMGLVGAGSVLAADPAATAALPKEVKLFSDLVMTVPESFESLKPKMGMIDHEFAVKAGEGVDAPSARITMMAAGGGVQPNIDRWKGQFSGKDKTVGDVEKFAAGPFEAFVIELTGTFGESMGGGPFSGGRVVQKENQAMLGAILKHPQGRLYFVKMVGPIPVIRSQRDAFINMIKSVRKSPDNKDPVE